MIRSSWAVLSVSTIVACLTLPSCTRPDDAYSGAASKSQATQLFSYDRNSIPIVAIDSERTDHGVLIRDAHFTSIAAKHGNVKFYLVRPVSGGSCAGILYFHWLGRPKGDRDEFLEEAIGLAGQGVISLLIQGYFPWIEDPLDGPTDRQQVIDQTIDARRALDLLFREPGVDPRRVAYVGHDYGAMYGGIISGIENRVKAYVLIAGMGDFSDWSLKYWPATATAGERPYREALRPVDPVHFIQFAAPAPVLFQFASKDKYISKETAEAFSTAASIPKTARWYETTHDMSTSEVATDRLDWLAHQLGFPSH
jgi:dienelactone hydrolase